MVRVPMESTLVLQYLQRLTPRILARMPGGPPDAAGRSPLDPVLRGLLSIEDRTPLGFDGSRGPDSARASMRRFSKFLGPLGPRVRRVRDGHMDLEDRRLAFRHYSDAPQAEVRPTLVYFHGGGFVIGDIPSYDGACRVLATNAAVDLVNVEYRLAPEHPFPAAHEDAAAAFAWVKAHIDEFGGDATTIAVGGDSAGGNLALSVCTSRARMDASLPAAQLLIYPSLDFTRSSASHQELGDGYLLDREMLDFFISNYLPAQADPKDPLLSPLLHPRGPLPPSLFILAGYDPLVDEGRTFSAGMAEDGVHVDSVEHTGLIHGFVNLAGICDGARDALVDAGQRLREMLTGGILKP